MDNDKQVDEAINSSEEVIVETTDEEVEETVPKATFNQVLARAKKAEDALKKNKPITKVEEKAVPSEDKIWEVAEYIREGYDRAEVDFIIKNGGKEALKDPNSLVSMALKAKQEQKKAEEAASRANDTGAGGGTIGKITLEQLKDMSPEEMAKHLPHAS